MGLFDKILGGVVGAGATTLLNSFIEKQGGLQNVVSQFEKNGFGDTMKSWISQGQNLPITADQIRQALGSDKVEGTGRQDGHFHRQTRRSAGATSAAGHRQSDPRREAPVLTAITPLTLMVI
jgi:uncharacterized protein YidB (DUF937 family)